MTPCAKHGHSTGRSDIPKIVTHRQDPRVADLIAEKLRRLGLAAIAVGDSELCRPRQRFSAHAIEFCERSVLFRGKRGQVRKMGIVGPLF